MAFKPPNSSTSTTGATPRTKPRSLSPKPAKSGETSASSSSSSSSSQSKNNAAASLDDEKFKTFLQNADEIESIEHFTYWKDEFLRNFRQYLDPLGTATAREADDELYFKLEKLAKLCVKTKTMAKEGKITPEKCSVRGRNSLNEMISTMGTCETSIDQYFPKTKEEEEVSGYTKFELAAVLVRDAFRVYGLMVASRDYIQSLVGEGGALEAILKPNQLSVVQYYFRVLKSFTQCMADLGMYKLMQKCEEIYKVRPRRKKQREKKFARDGSKDALSDTSYEGDTINGGRMFSRSRQHTRAIIDKGWSIGFEKGTEQKAPKKPKKKKTRTKKKAAETEQPVPSGEDTDDNDPSTLGTLTSDDLTVDTIDDLAQSNDDDDEYEASSEEGEEEEEEDFIYYFDPVKQIVGKVSRKKCLAEKLIVGVDDETGKETTDGAVDVWDSKDGKMGKTELISKLKDILRGDAKTRVDGLDL